MYKSEQKNSTLQSQNPWSYCSLSDIP